jgi:hypothetical protein
LKIGASGGKKASKDFESFFPFFFWLQLFLKCLLKAVDSSEFVDKNLKILF